MRERERERECVCVCVSRVSWRVIKGRVIVSEREREVVRESESNTNVELIFSSVKYKVEKTNLLVKQGLCKYVIKLIYDFLFLEQKKLFSFVNYFDKSYFPLN